MSDSTTISATKSSSGTLRLAGLSSGVDVDGLVKASLTNENKKIENQQKAIQKQEWMQSAYETINSRVAEFQNAYLTLGGSDDVSLSSTLAARKVNVSDSSAITVTASGTVATENLTIESFKKATAASVSSVKIVANDEISKVGTMTIDELVEKLKSNGAVIDSSTTTVSEVKKDAEGNVVKDADGNEVTEEKEVNTYKFSLNGKSVTINGDKTISDMVSEINNADMGAKLSYNAFTGKFSASAASTGASGEVTVDAGNDNVLAAIFAGATDQLGNSYTVGDKVSGTNASIKFEGNDDPFESENNQFSIGGYKFTIQKDSTSSVDVSSSVDTESMMNKITKFVDAYNGLMATLYSYAYTRPDRNYEPLTDDEKEKMSDKEVEEYEAKAKKGVLYGDKNVKKLMTDMRALFTSTVSETGLKFRDIGIATTAYSKDTAYGKIEINKDKLKSAIENNASDVASLFASRSTENGSTKGIAVEFRTLTQNYQNNYRFKISYSVTTKLDQMKELLEKLKDKLADKEDALYNKYSAMESSIAQMSGQSSFLFG